MLVVLGMLGSKGGKMPKSIEIITSSVAWIIQYISVQNVADQWDLLLLQILRNVENICLKFINCGFNYCDYIALARNSWWSAQKTGFCCDIYDGIMQKWRDQ